MSICELKGPDAAKWFPENTAFAQVSLDIVTMAQDPLETQLLEECQASGLRLSVHPSPLFNISEWWARDLSKEDLENYDQAAMTVLATAPVPQTEGFADPRHGFVAAAAHSLPTAVFMDGGRLFNGGLEFRGFVGADGIDSRQRSRIPGQYTFDDAKPMALTPAALEAHAITAKGMRSLWRDAQGEQRPDIEFERAGGFRRFRSGVAAWKRGLAEPYQLARVHQFVRSVEALAQPRIGHTKSDIVHRCCETFLKRDHEVRLLIQKLYDLRSTGEHMNDWKSYPNMANLAAGGIRLLAYHAQVLSGAMYQRVLGKRELLDQFRDDGAIAAFWASKCRDREALWGERLDPFQLTKDRSF